MSAYIVEDSTIDKVLTAIKELNIGWIFIGKQKRKLSDYPKIERDNLLQSIADDLLKMNTQAVNYRYNERTKFRKPIKPAHLFNVSSLDHFRPYPMAELVGRYKAMTCLLYQCSEGKYPKTRLYKQLDHIASEYAAMIVHRMPEYNAASWG
jgi:hypothetical protein